MKPVFSPDKIVYLLCIAIGTRCCCHCLKNKRLSTRITRTAVGKDGFRKTEELRKATNDELHHLANSDGLTKVANRRYFEKFLADEWNRAVRSKTEISLILIDIDHFKLFNDTYGHQAGDGRLKSRRSLKKYASSSDGFKPARFGGEEFVIVLAAQVWKEL